MAELTFENARDLGWATESTLKALLSSSKATEKLVDAIGKKYYGSEEALREAMGTLKKTVSEASGATGDATASLGREARRSAEENERYTDAMKTLQMSLFNGFTRLMDAGDTNSLLGNVSSSFFGAASSLKYAGERGQLLGKALGHAATALSAFAMVLDQVTKVADAMRQIYSNGMLMLDGFTGLAQAAGESGVRVAQFAEILSKYGRVAVTLGTRATTDLTRQFQRMTNFGGNLMMTQTEGLNAFMETLEIMRETGELQGLSQSQIAGRGTTLLKTFNDLAIATGRNRDELRRQTLEIQRQPLMSLWSRMLPEQGRARLTELNARIVSQFGQEAGGELAKMIERVATGGGGFGLIDEQFRPLLAVVPGFGRALQDAMRGVQDGTISQEEMMRRLTRSFDGMSREQLLMLSRANPQLASFVSQVLRGRQAAADAERQLQREAEARGMTVDALRAERAETERRLQELTGALNRSNAAVARLGMAFTKVAAALGPVLMPILDGLSWGLNHVSSVVETLADVIAPIASVIGPAIGLMGSVAGMFVDSIISVVAGFGRMLFIPELFSAIGSVLRGVGDGITAFTDLIGSMRDSVSNFFNGIFESVGNFFGIGDYLKNSLGQIFSGLVTGIGSGVLLAGMMAVIGPMVLKWVSGAGVGMIGTLLGSIFKIPGLALGGAGGALGKIFGGITSAFTGLFGALGSIISSGASMIGRVISGIGTMLAGAAKGIGSAIGGLLEGLGKGLSSIGTPQVLLGVGALAGLAGTVWLAGKAFAAFAEVKWEDMGKAALAIVGLGAAAAGAGALAVPIALGGAALGAAIGAIGLAIGGSAWLMGESMERLTTGLERLSAIDGNGLSEAARGMTAVGLALLGMTGTNIVSGLGGLVSGILGFFQADPIERLRRFAELGQPLMLVSDAITRLADSMERLSSINFNGLRGLTEILNLSRSINEQNIANLSRLTSNPQFIQTVQNIAQASQVGAAAPAAPTAGPNEPIIATAELNRRTIEYYDQSLLQFARMNELLELVNRGVLETRDANVTGMREVSDAIRSRGRIN